MKYLIFVTLMMLFGVAMNPARSFFEAPQETFEDVVSNKDNPRTTLEVLGYVEPSSGIRELSFEIGGVIDTCFCNVGDHVAAGQVLATLSSTRHRADLQVAEQQVRVEVAKYQKILRGVHPQRLKVATHEHTAIRHNLDFLERKLERADRLLESNAVSKQKYEQDKIQVEVERAELQRAAAQVAYLEEYVTQEDVTLAMRQVDAAKANVSCCETQLERCSLRAPFDGQILDILRREGEAVDGISNPAVFVFGDIKTFRVNAEIDEQYIRQVRPGMKAIIGGRNLQGQRFTGRVTLVKPRMGKKRVFRGDATERSSLHVAEVYVEMEEGFSAPVGLLVDVELQLGTGEE